MSAPIVFFDIAGPDDGSLAAFYSTVFDWKVGADGKFSVAVSPVMEGAIRRDPPEKRIYVGVPDVSASLAEVERAGGVIEAARFEVAGVVVLGLFRDPAGNPMGLVEMEGDRPRLP